MVLPLPLVLQAADLLAAGAVTNLGNVTITLEDNPGQGVIDATFVELGGATAQASQAGAVSASKAPGIPNTDRLPRGGSVQDAAATIQQCNWVLQVASAALPAADLPGCLPARQRE